MSSVQIIVTLTGLVLSVIVIWFFFFSKRQQVVATASDAGVQHINIRVKGGYDPDVIVVKAGQPVRLDFYRDETADCSEQVLFPDFSQSALLTPFQTTPVEFVPDKKGEFTFTCGMGMLRGKLIVQ
jgi:plastocyanin domain-containing protein